MTRERLQTSDIRTRYLSQMGRRDTAFFAQVSPLEKHLDPAFETPIFQAYQANNLNQLQVAHEAFNEDYQGFIHNRLEQTQGAGLSIQRLRLLPSEYGSLARTFIDVCRLSGVPGGEEVRVALWDQQIERLKEIQDDSEEFKLLVAGLGQPLPRSKYWGFYPDNRPQVGDEIIPDANAAIILNYIANDGAREGYDIEVLGEEPPSAATQKYGKFWHGVFLDPEQSVSIADAESLY